VAVLKIVLNRWGFAVVGDHDSGSTGFPDIDWDSPAWRAGDQHTAMAEPGWTMPEVHAARGGVRYQ
jgi:hypothetical protein